MRSQYRSVVGAAVVLLACEACRDLDRGEPSGPCATQVDCRAPYVCVGGKCEALGGAGGAKPDHPGSTAGDSSGGDAEAQPEGEAGAAGERAAMGGMGGSMTSTDGGTGDAGGGGEPSEPLGEDAPPMTTCASSGGTATGGTGTVSLCDDGFVSCEGRCRHARTDPNFCGATGDCLDDHAGKTCGSTEVCSTAECRLPREWTAPFLAEEQGNGSAIYPTLSVAPQGEAMAIWVKAYVSASGDEVWANHYSPLSGWGQPQFVQAVGLSPDCVPDVAMDASGNALAVWNRHNGVNYDVWVSRFVAGLGWQRALLLSTRGDGSAFYPHVFVDHQGRGFAVWSEQAELPTDAAPGIWTARYTPASGWGPPLLLPHPGAGPAFSPRLAFDAQGNALFLWNHSDGSRQRVWARRFVVGTGFSPPIALSRENAGDARASDIAFDGRGNAIATYTEQGVPRNNVWARVYRADCGWVDPVLLETNDAGDAHLPRVALSRDGLGQVVWYQSNGIHFSIWSASYDVKSGFSPAALLEPDEGGDAFAPHIATDQDGNSIALWYQARGPLYSIWSARYERSSGAWQPPTLLEHDDTGQAYTSYNSATGFDAEGNALAIWYQNDGTRPSIWSARFR